MLRAEIGPEIDLSTYTSQCDGLRESLFSVSCAEGEVLIYRKRLDMVFERLCPYVGLGSDTLKAQRQILRKLNSILPNSVKVNVCDVETARLSPCTWRPDCAAMLADLAQSPENDPDGRVAD